LIDEACARIQALRGRKQPPTQQELAHACRPLHHLSERITKKDNLLSSDNDESGPDQEPNKYASGRSPSHHRRADDKRVAAHSREAVDGEPAPWPFQGFTVSHFTKW
jgi:hypothetical protein